MIPTGPLSWLPQNKTAQMIDHGDAALLPWECMYNYDGVTSRARARLETIAAGEDLLGYEESAQAYRDMSDELAEARSWLHNEFMEAIKDTRPEGEIQFGA